MRLAFIGFLGEGPALVSRRRLVEQGGCMVYGLGSRAWWSCFFYVFEPSVEIKEIHVYICEILVHVVCNPLHDPAELLDCHFRL